MAKWAALLPTELYALMAAFVVALVASWAMSVYIMVGGMLLCPRANADGVYRGRAATVCLPPLPIRSAVGSYARAHGPTPDFPVCYDCVAPRTQMPADARADLWKQGA